MNTTSHRSPVLRAGLIVLMSVVVMSGSSAWAGNILAPKTAGGKGGAKGTPSAPGAAAAQAAATAAALQAAKQAMRAQSVLAKVTNSLKSLQAAQQAGRAAAQAGPNNLGKNPLAPAVNLPDVPDGLKPNGLVPDTGLASDGVANPTTTWIGAKAPVQGVKKGKLHVTIEQTQQQAQLNWQTFNVGKKTTLDFDQSKGGKKAADWVAFNKINDPTANPTQILGRVNAPGQVYIINQNGIIFGGSSQVNTHALVASSLPINDNLIQRGLLNNPDKQFMFSQKDIPTLTSNAVMPGFTAPAVPGGGPNGDVVVQKGAQITSPTNADHTGGKVVLVGPNVKNEGTISTPDGQTILAAGQQVAFLPHDAKDPKIRGLDVSIGTIEPGTGKAVNAGIIDAPRGNTTIAGKDVQQLGAITSTTSVAQNGSINLQASYDAVVNKDPNNAALFKLYPNTTGTVTLGSDSVTQILPETGSKETVAASELTLKSQIAMEGLAIHLAGDADSGAVILAPGADVSLQAGKYMPSNSIGTKFENTAGQVYLDKGVMIDVSGTQSVNASVTKNIVDVELRGAELADSPLQRDGPLRGQTIKVDIRKAGKRDDGSIWVGTPLADAQGYANLVQRGVDELTVNGGTVDIKAGDSVVVNKGASIDVSGGWINYQAGMVETTKLSLNGHMVDIADAQRDVIYDGFYGYTSKTYSKWGVTETYRNTLSPLKTYDPGYIYGGDAGKVSITAPAMALDGNVTGQTIKGPRQREVLPTAGQLELSFRHADPSQPVSGYLPISPTPPKVVFENKPALPAPNAFAVDETTGEPAPLDPERGAAGAEVAINTAWINENGMGNVTINNEDGDVVIPKNAALNFGTDGSLKIRAANINVQGDVRAAGGDLEFVTYDYSPLKYDQEKGSPVFSTPPIDPARGHFTLASTGSLSTAGLVVDDTVDAEGSLAIAGGTILINGHDVNLESGGVLDVSGGVYRDLKEKLTYGNGGSLVVKGGQDPGILALVGGNLQLNATMLGYSGGNGGSLTVQAPLIQVGGNTSNDQTLLLDPRFFNQGGFSSFTLRGLGAATDRVDEVIPGVLIAAGTRIAPKVQSWRVPLDGGGGLDLEPVLLPEGLRTPVSLSFVAAGVPTQNALAARGDVVMEEGASIRTDPRGSVTLSGQTATVLGSIVVPGGSITITGDGDSTPLFENDGSGTEVFATVELGADSSLSAAGTVVLTPDPLNRCIGSVLSGGTISIAGNIVAQEGARIDVSGVSGVLDMLPGYEGRITRIYGALNTGVLVPTRVESSGGTITLAGGQELFSKATLIGHAGGASAQGGNLVVSSKMFVPNGAALPLVTVPSLTISQGGPVFQSDGIGHAVLDADGNPILGQGYFAADSFNSSGMGSFTLGGGTLQFSGPVTLNAARSIRAGGNGIISSDAKVVLNAPYVALGQDFRGPVTKDKQNDIGLVDPVLATHGAGRLTVNAELIDVGSLSLQNTGTLKLNARGGDVRGDGTLDVAGDITIRAGQVYPTTGVHFNIAAYDYNDGTGIQEGTVTFLAAGKRPLPLSAGGQLNVYGSVINQGGALRAPIGSINLGWDGTGTAPYDPFTKTGFGSTRQLNLLSGSVTSVSAIDPITGEGVVIPYGTNLNGIAWIDPSGEDITTAGLPGKSIAFSAENVDDRKGSVVDLRGGGDLYAYRWVKGLGGGSDILAGSSSFAVVSGYGAAYAPVDKVYGSGGLSVGDQIYLDGSSGLAAGTYTLLPARYALLPGGFLVTPRSGVLGTTARQEDGSSYVQGYRFNGLDQDQTKAPLKTAFEVAPGSVVKERAEYGNFSANAYLKRKALDRDAVVPRLPVDAGQLVLNATESMLIGGRVLSDAPEGGRGSQVDISSPNDILIARTGATAALGTLVLDSGSLSAFGADSLLIGGVRQSGKDGTVIKVTSNNLTVDNAGSALSGPDVILAAKKNLTLEDGSKVIQKGTLSSPGETLYLGDVNTAGSGDGVLVRVASDPSAGIVRSGVSSATDPSLRVGAGARVAGKGLILDSTSGTSFDAAVILDGENISLNSGQVSLLLDNPGVLQPTTGLVLSQSALEGLQDSSKALSFLSYSSIDLYGTGTLGTEDLNRLELHAGEIRGFNNGGGRIDVTAGTVVLDNSAGRAGPGAVDPSSGVLSVKAGTIELGANDLKVDQFADVELAATNGVLVQDKGSLTVAGDLKISTPRIAGASGADQKISATGDLVMQKPAGAKASTLQGGLGAKLAFEGASVTAGSDILLPSGQATLHATTGDLKVDGLIDAGGTQKKFFDLVKYTDGGKITLKADHGDVVVADGAELNVSAPYKNADAGTVSIATPEGNLVLNGTLLGQGGAGGRDGSFVLDTKVGTGLGGLNTVLNGSGFTQSRDLRIRTGNVTLAGNIQSHQFRLSTDEGNITVTGTIDASGTEGGRIDLIAGDDVTLQNGSKLDASAEKFASDGKGGAVSLEAGSARWDGSTYTQNTAAVVDIQTGSVIDLTVAENTPATAAANAERGKFTGTLHIRAPRTATDVNVATIEGEILGASSIQVEGYKIYQPTGGSIDSVKGTVLADGNAFLGSNGTTTAAYTAMHDRLLGSNTGLDGVFAIVNGAEIINTAGGLTLGTATSNYLSNWDLSTYRFGPKGAAGVLTLRATGDITFNNALSDGFDPTLSALSQAERKLWTAPLMAYNPLLPANAQSWSYRITAGADLGATDFRKVEASDTGADGGSFLLGKEAGNITGGSGNTAQTASALTGAGILYRYQTVRTGSGDIDIYVGGDLVLRNNFATIYTAGTKVANPTIMSTGEFDMPQLAALTFNQSAVVLGNSQQAVPYAVQYSLGGGDVTLVAQGDIRRDVRYDIFGDLTYDSTSKQLPNNWLYRRGYVGQDGLFGQNTSAATSDVASTSWWVDFSNFFEGVASLGGGDVTMTAGRDVSNVEGSVATNARMPKGTPDASKMIELGGGDLKVTAGRNIDGGIYYVERGQGELLAGGEITTNVTRSPSTTSIGPGLTVLPEESWLPTTLFLGKGSFDVRAGGDLLLGPTVNTFLMPGGYGNSVLYKTYFSSYAPDSSVDVRSLTGDVTLRMSALGEEGSSAGTPVLLNWLKYVSLYSNPQATDNLSNIQPWIRLNESDVDGFSTFTTLLPSEFRVVAGGGDINLVGDINLFPSKTGTIELSAADSINGLQQVGYNAPLSSFYWMAGRINLSDADPGAIPGVNSPLAYRTFLANNIPATSRNTDVLFFDPMNALFNETGATRGELTALENKQTLHAAGLLHLGDPEPIRLYAGNGDVSGLEVFSGKSGRILAGSDISDVALYIQNVNAADVTVVAAGRDVIPYNAQTLSRREAGSPGNILADGEPGAMTGDIQISGPGTLQVLAGRNLDLGLGGTAAGDGTSLGIVSVGNARNPYLPFQGASITAGAGIGLAQDLSNSKLDFKVFVAKFLDPATSGDQAARYLPELGKQMAVDKGTSAADIWSAYEALSQDERNALALDVFYLVIRDAGRDYNNPDSQSYRKNYQNGYDAIAALFPGNKWKGDISMASRTIKTQNGGGINIVAPGGQLTVGYEIAGANAGDEGLLTEAGGNLNIFTKDNVNVGSSRIFTLRGGNEIIWSSEGNIAAGSSAKTVLAAPPTRVIIDPQSGNVQTDLAGLATGGGIGVLASVAGVEPGDVDLIAPRGTIDAGDAGIRVSGNLNIAAVQVLNASNIQSGGASAGVPSTTPAAPNISGLSAANSATAASSKSADGVARNAVASSQVASMQSMPSIVTVQVLGYGGGEGGTSSSDDEEKQKSAPEADKNKDEAPAADAPKKGETPRQAAAPAGSGIPPVAAAELPEAGKFAVSNAPF